MDGPSYFEIQADDTKRAAKFYAQVFGWKFEEAPGLPVEYWRVTTSGPRGGLQVADHNNGNYTVRILALPHHGQGNITMDHIAYAPKTGYLWVPAINIGSVDVVDTSNGTVREISGLATKELEVKGRKRTPG